jgi:hypothetical protein
VKCNRPPADRYIEKLEFAADSCIELVENDVDGNGISIQTVDSG